MSISEGRYEFVRLKIGTYKWHKHKTFFNYIDVYSSNFNSKHQQYEKVEIETEKVDVSCI
jgi:hypothetical protein